MSQNNLFVSVIIPTHNRAHLLPRTLASVFAQTYQDLEIIVVDDASTDETGALLSSEYAERITLCAHDTNQGAAAARNTGIAAASGRYVAFLDSDDVWLPTKIAKQVESLKSSSAAIAGAQSAFFNEAHQTLRGEWYPHSIPAGSKALIANLHINTSTLLFDKAKLPAETLSFDDTFSCFEDWDLLLRIGTEYNVTTIPDLGTISFVSDTGLSAMTQPTVKYEALETLCLRHHELLSNNPKAYQQLLHYSGRLAHAARQKQKARAQYFAAMKQRPISLAASKSLMRLILSLT